jgi:hypothetical protein
VAHDQRIPEQTESEQQVQRHKQRVQPGQDRDPAEHGLGEVAAKHQAHELVAVAPADPPDEESQHHHASEEHPGRDDAVAELDQAVERQAAV